MTKKNDQLKKINDAPGGFCLAKWYQVTIDLSRGLNHSCHHPERHLIPLDELKNSSAALHNTEFKKLQRKKMLEGIRPEECSYCWKIEDTPENQMNSDRFIKSTDDWAFDKLEETLKMPWENNTAPTYLEIMFSSECNLSCMYCMADVSSSVENEMKKFGPYPVKTAFDHRVAKIPSITSNNPYLEAFWKYLPEIYLQLKHFRITGGEPLLSQDTFKVLEFFENNPNPHLELSINTNLSYGPKLCEKLLSHLKVLEAKNCIKSFSFYVSLDAFGSQASYIRQGLNLDQFFKNIELIKQNSPRSTIVIMCTFNILSIASFFKLLNWIEDQKVKKANIILDVSYLKDPEYLRANLASDDLIETLNASLKKMKESLLFSQYETNKFKRVVDWIIDSNKDESVLKHRADFHSFIDEFDKRYNKNFLEIFPEYSAFYKICAKASLWLPLKS